LISEKYDTLERETRIEIKQIIATLRALMALPEPPAKQPIGLVTTDDPPVNPKDTRP